MATKKNEKAKVASKKPAVKPAAKPVSKPAAKTTAKSAPKTAAKPAAAKPAAKSANNTVTAKKGAPVKKAEPAKKVKAASSTVAPKAPVKAAASKKVTPTKPAAKVAVTAKAKPLSKAIEKATPAVKAAAPKPAVKAKVEVPKANPIKEAKPATSSKVEVRAPKHAKPAVKTAGKVENKVEKKSAVVSAAKGKIVEKATPKKPSKPLPTIDKVQLEKLENSFDNQAKIEYLKEKRNMQPDPPSLPVQTVVHRYNDKDLEEFKAIIDDKLEKARYQYENLIEQIKEITENTSGDFTKDLTDFSSSQSEVEMLNSMATRLRTFITDLQNALVRIRNKTYGICAVTGELIEKKRLIAVPTTTKSVLAKQHGEQAAA